MTSTSERLTMGDLYVTENSRVGADQHADSRQPHLWCGITDMDGDLGSVGVPSHDDEHRERAARCIIDILEPDWIGWSDHADEVVAAVAPHLGTCTLREHLTDPWHEHDEDCGTSEQIERAMDDSTEAETLACKREEGGCSGCEDAGWVCEDGDGPPFPYFTIGRQQMDEAIEAVRLAHLEDDNA